jgi:urease beta subunit
LIFNPQSPGIVGNAEGRARERAGQIHAAFVNSLLSLFRLCTCGERLDFSPGVACEMVM